jgi:hypothetical protein
LSLIWQPSRLRGGAQSKEGPGGPAGVGKRQFLLQNYFLELSFLNHHGTVQCLNRPFLRIFQLADFNIKVCYFLCLECPLTLVQFRAIQQSTMLRVARSALPPRRMFSSAPTTVQISPITAGDQKNFPVPGDMVCLLFCLLIHRSVS